MEAPASESATAYSGSRLTSLDAPIRLGFDLIRPEVSLNWREVIEEDVLRIYRVDVGVIVLSERQRQFLEAAEKKWATCGDIEPSQRLAAEGIEERGADR